MADWEAFKKEVAGASTELLETLLSTREKQTKAAENFRDEAFNKFQEANRNWITVLHEFDIIDTEVQIRKALDKK